MFFRSHWKGIIAFFITFLLGLLVGNLFSRKELANLTIKTETVSTEKKIDLSERKNCVQIESRIEPRDKDNFLYEFLQDSFKRQAELKSLLQQNSQHFERGKAKIQKELKELEREIASTIKIIDDLKNIEKNKGSVNRNLLYLEKCYE